MQPDSHSKPTGSSESKQINQNQNVSRSQESAPLLPAIYDIDSPKKYLSTNNDTSAKIESKPQSNNDDNNNNNDKLPSGQSTLTGVTFNLLNALVGAGILSIPYSYSKCGIIGGICLMIIFAIICTYTLNLLIMAGQKMNVANYEDLGYECYGYCGYLAVSLCLFLLDYGVMLTCLIIIGDCSFAILDIWGFNSYHDRQIIIILVSLIIIFPLCLRRDIAHIEIFSVFKMIALLAVTGGIIYECFNSISSIRYENILWFDINGIPFALGIFAFSFVCHDTAFLYYNSLYNPTMIRWTKLSLGGIGSAMFVSVILSIPAYLTFTDSVKGNILNNYQLKSYLMIIIRILYIICMALTYPIPLFVVRHICYAVYTRSKYIGHHKKEASIHDFESQVNYNVKHASFIHHILFSSCIFFSTLTISLFVDNLGIAMSIIGSISSINLAFVFPSLFYLKTCGYKWQVWQYNHTRQQFTAFLALYPTLALAIFGAIIGVYAIVLTLTQNQQN